MSLLQVAVVALVASLSTIGTLLVLVWLGRPRCGGMTERGTCARPVNHAGGCW